MRGIRLTKPLKEWLVTHLENYIEQQSKGQRLGNDLVKAGAVLDRVRAAEEPQTPGVNVRELEDNLVASTRPGLIARLITGHARASRQAANLGVTPAQCRTVGAWMDRQGWLTGPQTLIDVLNKWSQWLPKALATEPPPSLEPGLGVSKGEGIGDSRSRPTAPGPRPPRGRPAPGLR